MDLKDSPASEGPGASGGPTPPAPPPQRTALAVAGDPGNPKPPPAGAAAAVWVSLALIASSIEPLVVKFGYQHAATAAQLLVLKLLLGAVFMAPLYRTLRWIGWAGVRRIFAASLLFVATNVLLFTALQRLAAAVVITVVATTPALVALVNQARRRERAGGRFWTGFALCLVGVALTIDVLHARRGSLDGLGLLLAFGTVACSATYRTRMDDLTRTYSPTGVSAYLFLMNAALALAWVPWLGTVPRAAWGIATWLGLVAAVANVAFLYALHLLGSTRISVLTVLQRPLVIVAAAVFLHEPLRFPQMVGIAMVLVGVQVAKAKAAASHAGRTAA